MIVFELVPIIFYFSVIALEAVYCIYVGETSPP